MILKNVIRFIVLLLFQVLVLNKMNIGGYFYPAFYVYFILLLPFETAGWILLTASFFIGLSIDYFSNSLGINAAASVFIAYLRPWISNMLSSKREYEPGISPGIKDLGFRWFFSYALIMILVHHTVLFFLEVFAFSGFIQTIYIIILSTIATLILSLLVQYLFFKHDKT